MTHQSIDFLRALGKTEVFIRSWLGKGYADVPNLYKGEPGRAYNVRSSRSDEGLDGLRWDESEWDRMILELTRQNAASVEKARNFPYQHGGFCPYLVVNNGGHKQAEIVNCPALFIEFDSPITKEEAELKLASFPVPYSILIESRNGYHVYWILEKPTTPKLWRQIQHRLIEYFESDAGIEDPSRCMRLPGFDHLKEGCEPFLVNMKECHSDRRYSLEEFDAVLPDVPEWRLRLERIDRTNYGTRLREEGEEWDIRNFKHVLHHYREHARREWDTCQCPVHGGDGHSKDSLHINSQNGAYVCHAGCTPKEIFNEICTLAGWKRERKAIEPATKTAPIKKEKTKGFEKAEPAIVMHPEVDEEIESQRELLQEFAFYSSDRLDLYRFYPKALAESMHRRAAAIPVAPEALHTSFMPTTSGILGTKVKVQVHEGWTEPCILWAVGISPPGTKKTPAMNTCRKPLVELQKVAKLEYERRLEEYEQEKRARDAAKKKGQSDDAGPEPSVPNMRQYYLEDFTIETVIQYHCQEESSTGFTFLFDEFSEMFDSLGQYGDKRKAASDRKKLLRLWNGGDLKSDRKSTGTLFTEHSAVSIGGYIQDDMLDELLGDMLDHDGLWGRFLWCRIPYVRSDQRVGTCDINEYIKNIYKKLDDFPTDTVYNLCPQGRQLVYQLETWVEDQREHHPSGVSNALAKMVGYLPRMAAWLHTLHIACEEYAYCSTIPYETMLKAYYLVNFYIQQCKLIYAASIKYELPVELLKVLQAAQKTGSIDNRQVQRKRLAKDAQEAKSFLEKLEKNGFGTVEVSSRGMMTFTYQAPMSPAVTGAQLPPKPYSARAGTSDDTLAVTKSCKREVTEQPLAGEHFYSASRTRSIETEKSDLVTADGDSSSETLMNKGFDTTNHHVTASDQVDKVVTTSHEVDPNSFIQESSRDCVDVEEVDGYKVGARVVVQDSVSQEYLDGYISRTYTFRGERLIDVTTDSGDRYTLNGVARRDRLAEEF